MGEGVRVAIGKDEVTLRSKRVAAMVAFLVRSEERLGNISRGKLILSFAGAEGLSATVEEKMEL